MFPMNLEFNNLLYNLIKKETFTIIFIFGLFIKYHLITILTTKLYACLKVFILFFDISLLDNILHKYNNIFLF